MKKSDIELVQRLADVVGKALGDVDWRTNSPRAIELVQSYNAATNWLADVQTTREEEAKVRETLREYAQELYGTEDSEYSVNTFTLDKLIDSHRSLREMSKKFYVDQQAEVARAREAARAEYEMYTRKREYLKVSELRNMTLQEIVDLIS